MNEGLSLKEQKILWSVLNQAQDIGLKSLGKTLQDYSVVQIDTDMVNDWIRQTQDEYDMLNVLKAKLCGGLKK